ncbi:LVIVD repeat-containing protein [Euzebya pacifica]|uniref:LVIVD repeat-containing protein n=1 Tax=Euzebya pacifica TaxID=1608957 RepID=UPI0030F97206
MTQPRTILSLLGALALVATLGPAAGAHPDAGTASDGVDEHSADQLHGPAENVVADSLSDHDVSTGDIVSSGPTGNRIKDLTVVGRGIRNVPNATTDVWALDGYAYTGTFNDPCGGDPEAGIWVWDVHNPNRPEFVTVIPSPVGSRTNDVRVASMNSGDVLVHSNESCANGPGGFEVYDVDDPSSPVLLASVQTDDINAFLRGAFGFVDFGVHNLWLFSQGSNDYVAATVESEFGNFQIFDITDPTAPTLVGWWGAEELGAAALGITTDPADLDGSTFLDILALDDYLFDGFGASTNRFLHDVTISADGVTAYLANWDAGLVTLDISDPTDPVLIAVAIDPVNGSLDGEVNSHSVWPNEDGTIVIEGEEDFSAWEGNIPPGNLTLDGTSTPGDPSIPATAMATNDGDFFEATQTGLTGTTDGTTVAVDGGPTFDVVELATATGSPSFADTGTLSGEFVWIGRACTLTEGDTLLNAADVDAGDIAVVRRGACEFQEKADAAAAAGAAGVIIANNLSSTPWSGFRIWDYSDAENPVLASTFDTVCSASLAPSETCAANGTYSSHNVIVETTGNKTLAYIAWYNDGVLVLDISDPYEPREIARYAGTTEAGDPNDFWGIYKEENSPFIYASDRNGGLYVLKLKGSGRR